MEKKQNKHDWVKIRQQPVRLHTQINAVVLSTYYWTRVATTGGGVLSLPAHERRVVCGCPGFFSLVTSSSQLTASFDLLIKVPTSMI